MNIPNLHPPRWMPESEALRLEPGSLGQVIARKPKPARTVERGSELCGNCKAGRHHQCFSLRCGCDRCNPEIK